MRRKKDEVEQATTVKITKEVPRTKASEKVETDASGIVYDENPFMEDLVKSLTTKKKSLTVAQGSDVVLKDSQNNNEVLGRTRIYQEVEVDQAQYVKIFAEQMKHMFRLQPAGMSVLFFFLFLTKDARQMKCDHVRGTYEMYKALMTSLGEEAMSRATWYRGVKDLIEKRFIAPASIQGETKGWFFINPTVFWNGDRLEVAKVYIESKRNKAHEMRMQQPVFFDRVKDLDRVPNEEIDFSGPAEGTAVDGF